MPPLKYAGTVPNFQVLHQDLSEPEFFGDLVYKFDKFVGRTDFSDQFRNNIIPNALATT